MNDISTEDVKNILKYAQQYEAEYPLKKAGNNADKVRAQVILKEEGEGEFKWEETQNVKLDTK